MAWRHGHHRPRGGHPAPARSGRHAAVACGGSGPDQERQAHRPYQRHRGHPLDRLPGHHHRLHPSLAPGGDGLVRCHLSRLLDPEPGRIFHPRCQCRLLPVPSHRGRPDRLHARRGAQLRHPFHRLARTQPAPLLARRRGAWRAGSARAEQPGPGDLSLVDRRLPGPKHLTALPDLQPGLRRDDHRITPAPTTRSGRWLSPCS